MKKMFLVVLCVLSLAVFAADEPPAIPSLFWGTVRGYPIGTQINVHMDSLDGEVRASTNVIEFVGYGLSYSVDVPGSSEDEGRLVIFEIGGAKVGRGYWHSGMIARVNLFAPKK